MSEDKNFLFGGFICLLISIIITILRFTSPDFFFDYGLEHPINVFSWPSSGISLLTCEPEMAFIFENIIGLSCNTIFIKTIAIFALLFFIFIVFITGGFLGLLANLIKKKILKWKSG